LLESQAILTIRYFLGQALNDRKSIFAMQYSINDEGRRVARTSRPKDIPNNNGYDSASWRGLIV
jgi:hypothetical protein